MPSKVQTFDQDNCCYHFSSADHFKLGEDLGAVLYQVLIKTADNEALVKCVENQFALQLLENPYNSQNTFTARESSLSPRRIIPLAAQMNLYSTEKASTI